MPLPTGSANGSAPKPFSISLGSKKSSTGTSLTPKKRPHSTLGADGSDEEDEGRSEPQIVLGFDNSTGGAIGTNETPKGPLVISGHKNRSWQEEAERKKGKRRNLLPAEEQAKQAGSVETRDRPEAEKERTWGLVVTKPVDGETNGDSAMPDSEQDTPQVEKKPKTADEEALEALLSGKQKDSGLIIPNAAVPDDRFGTRITEGDAFRSDVESRPDMADLGAYSAIPVEEFGRAMLRGMGWKEGEEIGRKKGTLIKERKVERRAAGLGIGAKETPEDLELLGAWGKNAKKPRKAQTTFNPILMKNPKTGEMLTEEEYKARKENEKLVTEDDWKERRDKNLARDEEKRSERRHREDRERDYNRDRDCDDRSSRHSSSRRDRSYSPSHSSRRDRRRDYDDRRESGRDRDRDSDKDRERYSDREKDRDRGKDKHRSRDDDRYDKERRDRHRRSDDDRSSHRIHRDDTYEDDYHRSSKHRSRD